MVNFKVFRIYPLGFSTLLINISFVGFLIFAEFYFLRAAFNVLENKELFTYWQFVLFFLLSFGSRWLALIFDVLTNLLTENWKLKAKRYIGSQILSLLAQSRLNYFNTINKEGKIHSTIHNDLNNCIDSKIKLISLYMENISIVGFSIIFLIINNWVFGSIVVLSFFLMQLTPKRFKRRMEKINTHQSSTNRYYIADFSVALDNHLPLRLMHSASLLKKEMFKSSQEEIYAMHRRDRFTTLITNISSLFFFSGQRIVLLGAILFYSLGYFQGSMKIGDLLSLPQVLSTLVFALSYLVDSKLEQESANNYLKILKDQVNNIQKNIIKSSATEVDKNFPKIKQLIPSSPSITISNLSFNYGDKKVFDNLNLEFVPGAIYGIQGASGIGKSTLISLVLGKHDNYRGSIKIANEEVRDLSENNIYDIVKVVDASNYVFDTTIEENVTLFDESLDPLPAIKNAALLEEFKSFAKQKIEAPNLSEGQKQRVNLARLFQNIDNAKILILDEALSNLDITSKEKVKENFRKLKNQGYTLIFISHHIDKTDKFYDQLINLEDEVRK